MNLNASDKLATLKLQNLRHDFENLSIKDSESVKKFRLRITTIVNRTSALNEDLKEQKVVEKVLRSLDPKFNFIVGVIEKIKDLTKLTVIN